MSYIAPEPFLKSFTCPHCGVLSGQKWEEAPLNFNFTSPGEYYAIRTGLCVACDKYTIWLWNELLYPDNGNAPFPNPEMPESILKLYKEAASIHSKSPRGAAALLRLAIQKLMKELGEEGKNINSDIGNLVSKGLSEKVQKALDVVRVTGNDAVHPGQIDTDNPETVIGLFGLVNIIVEQMIDSPKRVNSLFDGLPDNKKEGIKARDKNE